VPIFLHRSPSQGVGVAFGGSREEDNIGSALAGVRDVQIVVDIDKILGARDMLINVDWGHAEIEISRLAKNKRVGVLKKMTSGKAIT
jgi:hypothetical protein